MGASMMGMLIGFIVIKVIGGMFRLFWKLAKWLFFKISYYADILSTKSKRFIHLHRKY